jgi:hypothetical protein
MQEQSHYPTASRVYSIVFILVFFAVALLQLNVPRLSLDTLHDNFLWRKNLIASYNNSRYIMGDKVFSMAIVGKDGWLYYRGEKSIEDYQKTLKLKPKDLQNSINGLSLLNKRVIENGGRLIVMIAPDKHTIYPQYMPDQIPVLGQMSRADMYMEFIKDNNNNNVEVVDLRPILIKASLSDQTYYKIDSHWNCLGAYYAYQEIMSRIATTFPETSPRPLTDYNILPGSMAIRDISEMMGFQSQEGAWKLEPKFQQGHLTVKYKTSSNDKRIRFVKNTRKDLPKAMVFHDSFYISCFDEFFEQQFSRTTTIHSDAINKREYIQMVETEKPDIVLVEIVERAIGNTAEYFNLK